MRLVNAGRVNPLLIGLVIEELEAAIEELIAKRQEAGSLTQSEDDMLRGFTLKRYLLTKKLRELLEVSREGSAA